MFRLHRVISVKRFLVSYPLHEALLEAISLEHRHELFLWRWRRQPKERWDHDHHSQQDISPIMAFRRCNGRLSRPLTTSSTCPPTTSQAYGVALSIFWKKVGNRWGSPIGMVVGSYNQSSIVSPQPCSLPTLKAIMLNEGLWSNTGVSRTLRTGNTYFPNR